ncbi:hypothetical protein HK104_008703 [Borealophlyctis nickersoniae]|nr:hypothetical protein HK104_008703 [Borealophlyctis nickersoniae]
MDALKKVGQSVNNAMAGSNTGNPNAGVSNPATTSAQASKVNPQYDSTDMGIDYAQKAHMLPASGTQQGNMIDQGQKAYDQYQRMSHK